LLTRSTRTNHDAIFLAIASAFSASFVIDNKPSGRRLAISGILSGAGAGLCLLTKQTIGLGMSLAVPAVVGVFLLRFEDPTKALQFLTRFAAGWASCGGALAWWLVDNGILGQFLTQAFIAGPAAKASGPGDFVVRSFFVMRQEPVAVAMGLLAALASWLAVRRSGRQSESSFERWHLNLLVFLTMISAIGIGAGTSLYGHGTPFEGMISRPAIYLALFGSTLVLLFYTALLVFGRLSRREMQLCLFALVSSVVAVMLSLSFPAFEAMVIPGLALGTAAALDHATTSVKFAIHVVCAVLVYGVTCAKLDKPFEFDGWAEPPVRVSQAVSAQPALQGFVLPETTVRFLDETVRIIREYPKHDTIFTYPEFGLIYGLSGRRFPTFSGSHNIDLANDQFARSEAQMLLRARPAVLVYGLQSDAYLVGQNCCGGTGRVVRNGQSSPPSRSSRVSIVLRRSFGFHRITAK
jgi:hypothetical protein